MSVESLAAVLHHSRATGTAKLVLIGIANHDGDGGAWPTLGTLGRYANVQPRNVRKALGTLQSLGEIRVHLQAGGTAELPDFQRPNRYDVLVSCPPWCDRTTQHRDTRARQSPLWTNPRTDATPPDGCDPRGETDATPAPRSESSPKPSIEPTLNTAASVPAPTTARARELAAYPSREVCDVCSLTRFECSMRARTNGHLFTPKPERTNR